MSVGLVLGCALGAACCLLLYALVPPRPRLGTRIEQWSRQRSQPTATTGADTAAGGALDDRLDGRGSQLGEGLGRTLVAHLSRHGIALATLRANLQLTDRSLETHLVRKSAYALAGVLIPAVFTVILLLGGLAPPPVIPLGGGLVLGALLFWLPDLDVARDAEQRRHELRRALSCYLDLVAMSLAGGRGIPEALPTAARIGSGWAFGLLRDTIDHARYIGITPWAALADLGERTGMRELQDLGGALMLVADDGAKVRSSLTARASTQRRRQLAEAEGAADKADQSIQMAQVVLAVGFFVFLGYPAVSAVMAV